MDVAGAMWALAEWMARTGRKEADAVAGEKIPFKNDKRKAKEVDGVLDKDVQCIAPLFNIVRRTHVSSKRYPFTFHTGG